MALNQDRVASAATEVGLFIQRSLADKFFSTTCLCDCITEVYDLDEGEIAQVRGELLRRGWTDPVMPTPAQLEAADLNGPGGAGTELT